MTSSNLNIKFDKVILSDTTFKVSKTDVFPENDLIPQVKKAELKYSNDLKLWDDKLKDILDNAQFSENEKIQFIKDALADTTKDAFSDIYGRTIAFWRSSKDAEILIENYFKKKNFESSSDKLIKYKHFEFRTKNLLPDSYDLIKDYFKNRQTVDVKYFFEGDLVYRLIELKKEKEAIEYLELLIDDYINGKINYLTLGGRILQLYEGLVFDFLCFSDDKFVAEKSTDLLFKLLEHKHFYTYELHPLTAYLNKDRHIKMLEKWFDFYKKVDFSPIDLKRLNDPNQKKYNELVPDANAFFSFIHVNSDYLGITRGRDMWNKFVETMPYWTLYGQSFETSQMYILENSFKDKSLSIQERQNMLLQAKKTERFLKDRDFYGNWSARFLQLVLQAYPDKKIPKDVFLKLQLDKILTYSSPITIDTYLLHVEPFSINLNDESIKRLTADLNEFTKSTSLKELQLSNRERFLLKLKSTKITIFDFFEKNDALAWLNTEDVEGNYVEAYLNNLLPILKKHNIKDIQISQETKKISEDESNCRIYLKSDRHVYFFEYSTKNGHWYRPQILVKMLNLCLMENKTPLRFIEIYSGDPATFVLAEPSRLKALLDKYNILCWAIGYNDGFHVADN